MKHTYIIDTSTLQSADTGETTYYGGTVLVTCISNMTLHDRWVDLKRWIRRKPRFGAYLPWSTRYRKVETFEFAVRGTDREGIHWPLIPAVEDGSISLDEARSYTQTTEILGFMADQLHDLVFNMVTGSDDVVVIKCK